MGDGQQQRVGLGDSFVFPELIDEYIRLGGIPTAEDRPSPVVDESDLVIIFAPAPEIGAITIVHQREYAAADIVAKQPAIWSDVGGEDALMAIDAFQPPEAKRS